MNPLISRTLEQINNILLGKEVQVKLAFTCLLCEGHLLIEDIPGLGKTTLSHALANTLDLSYNRIQFTSDLLPADLLGVSIFESNKKEFVFHPGPVFASIVLADEINRATPKAQSALLEAMEERQVSVDGKTRPLPEPFYVIATQNPQEQSGTFPLPESQLDRFFMRIQLGYPTKEAERTILKGENRRDMIEHITPTLTPEQLKELINAVKKVSVSDTLLDYVQNIIEYTREKLGQHTGLSPRGGLALVKAAKAWALIDNRDYVLPEDVQAILANVVEHRINPSSSQLGTPLSNKILTEVPLYSKT
ncbi:MoxR-like ATPase [Oleiphilus messinensis]|uniref:MoxR-like ATPase n=1 Tax=Oleiphilus messinensis TaxID=141451 RepID=A0A1Y0I7D6_9GAMM|nr:AAA family ATPase [Oleiphilus messinensis]ARU56140.1 MoxR-like ATPase [Oleiphilus messinensis]